MGFKRTTGAGDWTSYKKVPCVIGIDQSYTRTGIAICVNGKLKKITSIDFKYIKTKTGKRFKLQEVLKKAIESCLKKFKPEEINIICERIRTFTGTDEIRPDVIKSHAQLIAYIVDTAFVYGIQTYSVDTRAWKSGVLGTCKPLIEAFEGVKDPKKIREVKYIISLGFEDQIVNYKNNQKKKYYDDDAADAACIALYGFVRVPKCKKEQ